MRDAFIENINSGEIHLPDVDEGKLINVSSSIENFKELLSDKEFVVNYFPVNFIGDLVYKGLELNEAEVYSLIQPTVLSGEYILDNIKNINAEVHFSLAGQIHQKI